MSTILALDIGTEYVKAAISKVKNGTLEVIGIGKSKQQNGSIINGAIADIQSVISVCEKALIEAEEEAKETTKQVVVGIANNLVKGTTTEVHYVRENPNRPITEDEMNIIIQKVQEKTGETAQKTIALETGNELAEIRLINSAIVSLMIDGYKISNPIGFKGSDVVVQFYTAFAPLIHVAAIEKICAELNLELMTIAVEPFAVCRACLGDELDANFSGIILDIGGKCTNIAVIDDGGVKGTKTLPIGNSNFEQKDAIKIWLSGIGITLEEFNLVDILPKNILLCGGGANSSEIQEILAISDWYKDLNFSRRPLIDIIDTKKMPDILYLTKNNLDCSYITALGLLRVGVDVLMTNNEKNNLKTKITKLLQK